MSTLYCLARTATGYEWKSMNFASKYTETYHQILHVLGLLEGSGYKAETYKFSDISEGNIVTKILHVESHRCCTVLYCLQYDADTNGARYLVYGTKWNQDSDYGIGIELESDFIIKSAEEHCPPGRIAKYL